jgi:hypothetical protein
VYVTCTEDLGSEPWPVYAIAPPGEPAEVSGNVSEDLATAIRLWLRGPSPSQHESGLGVLPVGGVTDGLRAVEVRDGRATIDFEPTAADVWSTYGSTGMERLIAELRGQVFQFDQIQQLEVSIEDSCRAFWELSEKGECTVLRRRAT